MNATAVDPVNPVLSQYAAPILLCCAIVGVCLGVCLLFLCCAGRGPRPVGATVETRRSHV